MQQLVRITLVFSVLTLGLYASEDQTNEQVRIQDLLERALQKAADYQQKGIENQFKSKVEETSRELDSKGQVEKEEKLVYVSRPIQDYQYRRLIQKQDRDLTLEEEKKEVEKEKEFIEQLENGEEPSNEQDRITFDKDLTDRFDYWLKDEIDQENGNILCVLAFRPKEKKLPVNKRIDRALNESEGELWIDEKTAELVKVKFGIKKKIKLWWGLIGSIYELDGTVIKKEIEPGIWLTDQVQMYINGRIFFSKFRKRIDISWSDYVRVE